MDPTLVASLSSRYTPLAIPGSTDGGGISNSAMDDVCSTIFDQLHQHITSKGELAPVELSQLARRIKPLTNKSKSKKRKKKRNK